MLAVAAGVNAASLPLAANATAIAHAMRDHRVILLGEVHDNRAQHALRIAALRLLVEGGARPALAFEQFDRERQPDIERARTERPRDADYVIARGRAERSSWHWESYRPFVALALEYDLPIVAANLSRADAMRVATSGWNALFDAVQRADMQLDAVPASVRAAHERALAEGHCNLLPADALPAMAQAQMARDIVLAQAIHPHLHRGVVLLAGNGHVRTDIGVPLWLPAAVRASTLSIGMLEHAQGESVPAMKDAFDRYVLTAPAERPDPCRDLASRLPQLPPR